jgi:DUF438 domain-containing protein
MVDFDNFFKEKTVGGQILEISQISREIDDLRKKFLENIRAYETDKKPIHLVQADENSGKLIDLLNIRLKKLYELKNKSKDPKEKKQFEDEITWAVNNIREVRSIRKKHGLGS